MPAFVLYTVLVATPAVALLAAGRALERWCGAYRIQHGDRQPSGESLERLAADLRRLEDDYRRIAGSDLPARVTRMRSVTMAYDDTLCACCQALGLPEPGVPLSSLDRLETEAALAQQGLSW